MKVIIAARLSQKLAGKGQGGIESQDVDAREWAEGEGHEVIATVPDTASGTKAMWERPNLKPWVTDPEIMATYGGIVAAKQDRLSRADWSDEAKLRMWAEDNGKTLFIVDRNLRWPPRNDINHDDDVSRWNDGAEAAYREWNSTSRRYKRMGKQRKDNNELHGRAVYGYRAMGITCREIPCRCWERKEDDHKTLVIHEPEAKVIREAVQRYLDGESIKAICDDFNARHIASPMWRGKPGNHWNVKTLAGLLRSTSIAGRRMSREEKPKTVLTYKGIISWADHEKLVARLNSRANRQGISPANAYMLTGILFDVAGHPMYGIKGGRRNNYLYYNCRMNCEFAVRMDQVDQEVSESILDTFGNEPHMVRRIIPGKNWLNEIANLRQTRNELDDLADDYEEKRSALQAQIRELSNRPAEDDEIKWLPSGKTIADVWNALDTAGRRDWLRENGWVVTAVQDDLMPNGWRLTIDAGWTAEIGAERQAKSFSSR